MVIFMMITFANSLDPDHVRLLSLIWIQPDTLMHENRMDFSLGYLLTHISLASFLWDIGKQRNPDKLPNNVASDQGLHCLLTECSFKS